MTAARLKWAMLVGWLLLLAVILPLTYRSLLSWLIPLVSVGFAAGLAQGVVYLRAHAGDRPEDLVAERAAPRPRPPGDPELRPTPSPAASA